MKTLTMVIASFFNLLAFGIAYAHGDHEATHGGVVGRGNDDIVVEFVVEKGTLNLYVHDEAGNSLDTKNITGTLTVISRQGPAREVKLVSAGSDKLAAPGIEPVWGDKLRARIKLPTGEEHESAALFTK